MNTTKHMYLAPIYYITSLNLTTTTKKIIKKKKKKKNKQQQKKCYQKQIKEHIMGIFH